MQLSRTIPDFDPARLYRRCRLLFSSLASLRALVSDEGCKYHSMKGLEDAASNGCALCISVVKLSRHQMGFPFKYDSLGQCAHMKAICASRDTELTCGDNPPRF